jgi:GntR family transcriptional regulator
MEIKVIYTPEEIYDILGLNRTLFLKRCYLRKNEIYGFSHMYMLSNLSTSVTWDIAEKNSGYSLLTKYGGYQLKNANLAIRAFPGKKEHVETLKIRPNSPILSLSRTTYTRDDRPIEHLQLFLRADTCEFNISVPSNFSIVNGIRETSAE